jgi:acyl-CoA synthetase (NDP forming)
MDQLFSPRSIVVIGVSDDPANLGRVIAANLERFHFAGPVHLVGRRPASLDGRPILTMEQLPEGVNLAILLTPAATVPAYLEACGQKGIRWAVIESGGFSEYSLAGRRLEEECRVVAKRHGLRFVGPNCLGISSTACGLATSFLPTQPEEIRPGRVAIVAQSGGVIRTCAVVLAGGGLGVSKTVSVGNKADLKEADYLRYFLEDPETGMVVLYLESILDGKALVELARAGRKPVLVFKSNTGPASARAAASHTAALANDEQVIEAAFKQAGILRLRRFSEMTTTFGKVFAMPPVAGRRLAVFSRSGGHAIIAADAASEFGFDLPPFSLAVLEAARPYFRASIMDTNNPLDLGTVFDRTR